MDSSGGRNRFVLPLLKGLWIYSLILWAYIAVDRFIFPQFQFDNLSLYVPIPEDLIAVIAFPVSFLAFVAWEYLRSHQSK